MKKDIVEELALRIIKFGGESVAIRSATGVDIVTGIFH